MPHFQIKHRRTNAVLFEGDFDALADCVSAAVKAGTSLGGANLGGANLSSANLYGADLRGADLSGAALRGADLSGADMRGADLSGADLRGADLSGASLIVANLISANLARANLAGTSLARADLAGAKWKEGYTLRRSPARIATRGDGYTFYLLDTNEGGWRISAGCRFFTPEEAWAHWERTRPEDGPGTLGAETRDILTMFELAMEREARNAS